MIGKEGSWEEIRRGSEEEFRLENSKYSINFDLRIFKQLGHVVGGTD